MNVLVVVSVLITRGVIELRDVAVLIILGITKSGSATLSITRGVGRRELVQRDHMLGGGGWEGGDIHVYSMALNSLASWVFRRTGSGAALICGIITQPGRITEPD